MRQLARVLCAVAMTGLLAACGSDVTVTGADDPVPVPAGATSPVETTTSGPVGGDSPPPFRIRYDDKELVLAPYTWCYENACVDGVPIDVPSVGSPTEVRVFVPVEGLTLDATATDAGEECGRQQQMRVTRDGEWFVLHPAGTAGDYKVDLFAHGGGDMAAQFRWTTSVDGPQPEPEAVMSVIADHDGRPDSYGVELSLSNLATTPTEALARITVTAANGRSLTFDAQRSGSSCWPVGSVFYNGPDKEGRAAAALGDFPFRYDVDVTIDGVTHHATAQYPADEIKDNEPNVRLQFSPPLPALS